MGNMRKFIINTLLVILSITVLLVVMEAGIRLYSTLFFPKMMVLDDNLGWRHARDTEKVFANVDSEAILVKQNRYGHRGGTYPLEKSPGKYRVLVLGDSFTEGVQVSEEDLFTHLVEEMYSNVEMLNAGVGGYGTVQQYMYLMLEGLQFEPDAVLLMFYRNDLKDNCSTSSAGFGPRPHAVEQDGAVRIIEDLDISGFSQFALPVPFLEQMNRHSYLYNFMNTRIYQKIRAREMRERAKASSARLDNCKQLEIFFDLLGRFRDVLSERAIEFFVMLIPSSKQAANGSLEPHTPILEFCARQGLRCASLMQVMHVAVGEGARPYFERDIHWTTGGHEIAAAEIRDLLSDSINNRHSQR